MEYRKLMETGIEISPIVLGTWALGGGYTWGDQDNEESIRTVHSALDGGITTFDTAEFYGEGRSEEILGKALDGRRSGTVICSKVWTANMGREGVVKACEGSLKRLGTDYLDFYMIHWPNREIELTETLEAMLKLKSSGKVRAIGVCNFGVQDLSDALRVTDIAVNQLPYSLLFRAVEYKVLPKCVESGVPVMAYSSLAQGLLTGKFASPADVDDERARIRFYSKGRPGTVHAEEGYEDLVFKTLGTIKSLSSDRGISMSHAAVNWVLSKPGVLCVLVGARKPEQIEDNISCLNCTIDDELVKKLDKATGALQEAMGPNPDMWRTESRFR
ncbi:MAG: aldo/keto reductase [Spirochaetia bacterium]